MFEMIVLTACIVAVILALNQSWLLVGACFVLAVIVTVMRELIDYFKGE